MEKYISKKDFDLDFMKNHNYTRKKCVSCKSFYWSINPDDTLCGDSPCVNYSFIGNPPTKRSYNIPEMRDAFLSFFEKHDHGIVNPYPVVAKWRDDLLVTIASIVNFQPHITDGLISPQFNPLVVSQPCLRFDDLEFVGRTAGRHMTIFEMGGHHAFNLPNKPEIYWKNKTIELHHEFATKKLGISEDLITYKEHFWVGGGNAGPDIEGCILGLEVSTLVFMIYKVLGEKLIKSPVKTVDTGYGIDRWTWLSQGKNTAFESIYGDLLYKILKWSDINIENKIIRENSMAYTSLSNPAEILKSKNIVAEKLDMPADTFIKLIGPYEDISAILDHSKALIFLLSDGAILSNVMEGYLSRLLFRRFYRLLSKHEIQDKMSDIIEGQIKLWGNDFPRINEMSNEILTMVEIEKNKYLIALNKGTALLERQIDKLNQKGQTSLDLNNIIELYESHGLHPEIIENVAKSKSITVQTPDNFLSLVAKKHQEKQLLKKPKPKTNSLIKKYKTNILYHNHPYIKEFDAKVLFSQDNLLILDNTSFYPEGGGQVGDTGKIIHNDKTINVLNTKWINGNIVHIIEGSNLSVENKVKGIINWDRRIKLMRNHTATHIILSAARKVLGKHIWQAGAEKKPNEARLDITHYKRLEDKEIYEIERLANTVIDKNMSINVDLLSRVEAETKYGTSLYQGGGAPAPILRVVKTGDWDVEACGGTHCESTGELMIIKIIKTDRIQDGIERLVFTTGMDAINQIQKTNQELNQIAVIFDIQKEHLITHSKQIIQNLENNKNEIKFLRNIYVEKKAEELIQKSESINGIKIVLFTTEKESDLILIGEHFISLTNDTIYLGYRKNKGISCVIFIGEKLIKQGLTAIEIAKEIGTKSHGGASGDNKFAKAGGKNDINLKNLAFDFIRRIKT